MVRVMIVDDEAPVRWSLQLLLGSAGDIEVVAACDGVRAVEEAQRHRPDVVLLDLRMPQVDGLAVLREMRRWPRPPAVAVLTTSDSDEFVDRALGAGAAGVLVKDTEPEQLVRAVRTLAAGGDVPSPAVPHTGGSGYVDGGARAADRARIEAMSPRERDVLGLIGQGLSNVEIGRRLQLSTAAVKDYVRAVLDRLNVTDRVQAAVVAREAGMPPAEGESR
ncbi:MAG TPA: response regulator transcription factor [Geodermatophilus sp.]|nr:response regulator transcription factor [Geodermatophilus sp.]